eukprot:scaffold66462_cov32-Tisochrysis_lutea.AAC.2
MALQCECECDSPQGSQTKFRMSAHAHTYTYTCTHITHPLHVANPRWCRGLGRWRPLPLAPPHDPRIHDRGR